MCLFLIPVYSFKPNCLYIYHNYDLFKLYIKILLKNNEFFVDIFEGFWCLGYSDFSLGLHNCRKGIWGKFTTCFSLLPK